MYAQFLIHISIGKSANNNRESTILYYNSYTLSASYGHVTFSLGEIRKHPKQIAIEINHIPNQRSRAAL